MLTHTSPPKKIFKVLKIQQLSAGSHRILQGSKGILPKHSFPAYLLKPMFTQMLSWSLEGIKNLLKFSTQSPELNKHKEVCLHGSIGLIPCIHLVCSKLYGHPKLPPVAFPLFSSHFRNHGTRVPALPWKKENVPSTKQCSLGCTLPCSEQETGTDSPLWADNSPQEQDSSASRDSSSCGFVHLQKAKLLPFYLLFSSKWQSTYTFRRELCALILSPQEVNGASQALYSSLQATVCLTWQHSWKHQQWWRVLRNSTAMQTTGLEPSSGEAIEQLDLWWNLLRLEAQHLGSITTSPDTVCYAIISIPAPLYLPAHDTNGQRPPAGFGPGQTGDVLLEGSVWGNTTLCLWRSEGHWGEKRGYFLAPATLRYDLRKTRKKPHLGRGTKDPGCQKFSSGSFPPTGRTLCCQGSLI